MTKMIEKYDAWRKEYHPMGLMNEAMAEAAWISAYKESASDEREACAKVCEEVLENYRGTVMGKHAELVGDACAAAIRVRGNT